MCMIRSFLALLVFAFLLLVQAVTLTRCATPTSPTGGARDTLGPVLVVEESTPNFRTNFRPEEIRLTFDEWVELDPKQQIVISPPLELGEDNQPYLRRRSLVIPLTGLTLRDSVTYVVNVGAAIKDLNEGNPTENLRFVFATGPVLDSATVSGTLVDDFTGEPLEKATFTLYDNLADSAALTQNPTYFAVTDEAGRFEVSNVRPGRYRAVGLVRNAGATNYYVDLDGTFPPLAVGFVDTAFTVADGSNTVGTIRVSPLPVPVRVQNVDTSSFGQVALALNQPAANVDLRSRRTDYLRYNEQDTLRLFYRRAGADTLLLGQAPDFPDTVIVGQTGSARRRPPLIRQGISKRLPLGNPAELVFTQPLERVDPERIQLAQDTLTVPVQLRLDTVYPGRLRVEAAYRPGARYELTLLPGAVTAWNEQTNPDTLRETFAIEGPEKFGRLTLRVENLNPTYHYILRLTQNDEVVFATRRYIEDRFSYQARFNGLKPGTYRVEVLYDSNENQRYDSGDFLFGRQPELVRRFELAPLRANWEVEEVIDLK